MIKNPPTPDSEGPTSELGSDAKHFGHSVTNRLHSEVDTRKSTAADQARSVSSAIQRATGELNPDAPDWLKSALRQGASKIQAFADTIDQRDSRELMRDVQDFARNNPGTFIAACAAAGFAAARVLKAGAEPHGSLGSNVPQTPRVATPTGGELV